MPSYDVHQHLWPEQLISALSRRKKPPRLRGNVLELAVEGSSETDLRVHDLDARLALLDRHELDVAVVSLPPSMEIDAAPELAAAYHEGIVEVAAASDGHLRPLAYGKCLEGFAGACVSAGAVVAGLGSLLDELERAGQFLFVHPGPPPALPPGAPAWWASVVDYTAQMQAAYAAWLARDAETHPHLPVVFAILAGGGPFQLERLRSRGVDAGAALHANGYFDTASYGRRALELCVGSVGVDRLVFGSDTPVIDAKPTLQAVAEFGDAVVERVCRENPAKLLARTA